MFQSITTLPTRGAFALCNPAAQAFVIANPTQPFEDLKVKWKDRAAVVMWDDTGVLHDIVRELLFNPQIRAVVFDGDPSSRPTFQSFWSGELVVPWKIDLEHLQLIRQFVDLYDDDFMHRVPQAPFWPVRIKYLETADKG
jgi:hypothetical protein